MSADAARDDTPDIAATMRALGGAARAAAVTLGKAPPRDKDAALKPAAAAVRTNAAAILEANARDLAEADGKGLSAAMIDRLALDEERVEGIARSLDDIATLKDPIGDIIDEWTRPNGLRITRVRVPLGVIGIIYESRPNVTADAGALCLKSGNAVILRGGSESFHSSQAIHECLAHGLKVAGLPEARVTRQR